MSPMRAATDSSGPCSSPRASWSPARRPTRASSASSRCTTCWRPATRAGCSAPTSRAQDVLGVSTAASRRRPARRRGRSGLRLHAGLGQPRAAAGVRAEGHHGGVRHLGRLRRGGRGGTAGRRTSWSPWPTSSGSCWPGPNGQGVVSTPAHLCAQIVAPYPPAGSIAVASQSGNFVSSFMNYAAPDRRRHQPGRVGRQRRRGQRGRLPGVLRSAIPPTGGGPGLRRGDRRRTGLPASACGEAAVRKPLVLVKGGATEGGQRAAASHTGALASDDRVFDGVCRQTGATRAATVEEAFEAAATFATQPLPAGPNVVVLTTAGGWGVVTADAITRDRHLDLLPLPDDLRTAIDAKLPPRWSRDNPVDCAGGETRDTIPEVMALVADHPDVRRRRVPGPRHPVEPGPAHAGRPLLPRSRAGAHRRLPRTPGRPVRGGRGRDQRAHRQADPHRDRAGRRRSRTTPARPPSGPRDACATPSADRAVTALGHLYRHARWRERRGLWTGPPGRRRSGRRPALRHTACRGRLGR